ncbi:MAG: OmpH family outer membrane protein [Candidatus Poribacteria bacterium]
MRRKFSTIFSAVITLSFMLYTISAFAQSPIRIAVVDTEKVFQDSVWGKKALELLDKETEGWQKKGEDIEKELTRLEEELTKQRTFLDNKEEEKKLQDQIDSKRLEGQNLIQESNLVLRQKQQELMEPIIQEIKDLIKKIAVEEKYDLILEKQLDIYKIVLYVNPELDITNRVTAMLDKSYRDKNPEKAKDSSKSEPQKKSDKPAETDKKDTSK